MKLAAWDIRERPVSSGLHVVLLGTQGGPIPGKRAGVSTAIAVDGHLYLVDAGSGLPLRFAEAGLTFRDVRAMFITHMHSDHVADLYNFFSLNWTNWDYENQTVDVIGPGRADRLNSTGLLEGGLAMDVPDALIGGEVATPGVRELFELSVDANAYDINQRLRSTRRVNGQPLDFTGATGRPMVSLHEIGFSSRGTVQHPDPSMSPELVFEDDRVRVTATLVHHPPVFPAFAFRFDTAHGSVVVSGDTSPCENLSTLAAGADLLVNEVMAVEEASAVFKDEVLAERMHTQFSTAHTPLRTVLSDDGTVEQVGVGELARVSGVRGLALTHIYPADGPLLESDFAAAAGERFDGPVFVGRDFLCIDVPALRAAAI
jgi:ribonuclease BN (tRNA processing enzyme)